MTPALCPVCRDIGGFHLDGPHHEAVARIPAHLKSPSNTVTRAMKRDKRRAEKQAA